MRSNRTWKLCRCDPPTSATGPSPPKRGSACPVAVRFRRSHPRDTPAERCCLCGNTSSKNPGAAEPARRDCEWTKCLEATLQDECCDASRVGDVANNSEKLSVVSHRAL